MGAVAKFFSWVLRKLTFGVVLAAAGLAGFGLWLYVRENVDLEQLRQETVRELTGRTAQTRTAWEDVKVRLDGIRVEAARWRDREAEAARLRAGLEAETGALARLSTPAEQVKLNEERLARLRQIETEARDAQARLAEQITRAEWERDGLQVALGRLDGQLREAEARKSELAHYARLTWERYGRYVVAAVLLWFLGPPVVRLIAYFVVAPFVSTRRSVQLGAVAAALPEVRSGGASVDVELEPGDVLWVKERFLQASDEGLLRRTQWLLDWRMPFTCLAAGLRELIELRNAAPVVKLRATFSSQQDAHVELAVVAVPAGASLVLRPTYLAGLIGPVGRRRQAIRRHWRLFSLQSWATGQFRYFEFVGPCTLLVAGSRGVRVETLRAEPGLPVPGRRANQDATLGFTPGLGYRPVRAETFWAYFRGQNPLFDDLFEGTGVFLCQQTSAKGEAAAQRAALAGFWQGLGRIFGL